MIYAPRGVGKTWVAMNIAWAVATGGAFLRWGAPVARKVIYVDGEMPGGTMQERLATIVDAHGREPEAPDCLRIVSSDLEEFGVPDLSTIGGQSALDAVLGDADLIVLDNLSTLCRSGRENEAESWGEFQSWLLAKRREGRCVLLVHHAGKGGAQRGTSKREDVLDTVIALRRPGDYDPGQGARFEVHFEKARGFAGTDAAAFEVAFADGGWTQKDLADEQAALVMRLKSEGLKQRDIAGETGLSLSKVNRIIKRAEAEARNG